MGNNPNTEAWGLKSLIWSTWFLCLVPEIEISKNSYLLHVFISRLLQLFSENYLLLIVTFSEKIKDEFWFAYCGMNHSDTLDLVLILIYSLSFNHHHHLYFIIMTQLSNEKYNHLHGPFLCLDYSILDHFQHCLPTILHYLINLIHRSVSNALCLKCCR